MRVVTSLCGLAQRFLRHRQGNFGMMLAITAPVLLLGAGYAVNVAQITLTKSNLLAALDSAVTSTARDLTTGAISEEEAPKVVEAFLMANGLRAYAEEGRLTLDELVVDRILKTVSAKASVELDVAFALFGSANHQKIRAESAAIYSDKKVEVAMMLDLTGSMKKVGREDKLGDLQKAAQNAVTTLLGKQNPDKPRVRVALVPYANSVNVGRSMAETAVFVELKQADRTTAPPNHAPKAVTLARDRADFCATERKGTYRYTDDGPEVSMVNRDLLLTDFAGGFKTYGESIVCPVASVVPLTPDVKVLSDSIKSFVADGGTGGHIGVQWTWYMLSEKWKNVVGPSAAPAPMDRDKVGKYAILMTDGDFNLGFDGAARVQDVYGTAATQRSVPQAKMLCTKMREAGIEIFTVGFKLPNAVARDVMASCASTPRHFFDTDDGDQLNAAFMAIARNIESVALTK